MSELRQFQLGFGRYLRDPAAETLPPGIPPRRARIYEELLFNNLCGFINKCFPVCRSVIDAARWQDLCRKFFRDWRSQTPIFSATPGEFLVYLEQVQAQFPPWFYSLAHYEWIELGLDVFDERVDERELATLSEPVPGTITVRPEVCNLSYDWPVHRICRDYQPEAQAQTFLVVLRTAGQQINFIEINAATSMLIDLVRQTPLSRAAIAIALSQRFNRELNSGFAGFCDQIIDALIEQQVLTNHESETDE